MSLSTVPMLLAFAAVLALALLWPRWRMQPATRRVLAEVIVSAGVLFVLGSGVLMMAARMR